MAEPKPPGELGDLDAGHAAAEGVDAPADPGPSKPSGIVGVLLHTEPALSVSETERELGLSTGPAHFVVAGRKALDALIDGTTGSGTTVIEHVVAGTVSVVSDTSGDTSDDGGADTSEETAPIPADGGPA